MIILSFCLFLLLFVIVGVLSAVQSRHTSTDYLIAGRTIKPWLAALSAVATNNSGYMFIGMIGFTYMVGISSIWLLIGWITGDFISSTFVHNSLRIQTGKQKEMSYASLLGRWEGENWLWVRRLGGIITLLFLGIYAAAQLKAGSKALHVLFGWDYKVGALVGAIIVVIYCFAGGIRASIWTDAAQSFVMIVAMACLFVVSLHEIGGIQAFVQDVTRVSPTYHGLFPPDMFFGPILGPVLFVLGWLFAGFGVTGQPHIMIRFMAINKPEYMTRTKAYYYTWYLVFYLLTFGVGLMARLLMPEVGGFDEELALPSLAKQLLVEFWVGLVLAGLFAATMSTADSQILSCTAAISHDLQLNQSNVYWITKFITVLITIVALLCAWYAHDSVFKLVLIAWSALAASFTPLLVVRVLGYNLREMTAVMMMTTGLSVTLFWHALGFSEDIYEIMPGILSGFIPFIISQLISLKRWSRML